MMTTSFCYFFISVLFPTPLALLYVSLLTSHISQAPSVTHGHANGTCATTRTRPGAECTTRCAAGGEGKGLVIERPLLVIIHQGKSFRVVVLLRYITSYVAYRSCLSLLLMVKGCKRPFCWMVSRCFKPKREIKQISDLQATHLRLLP